MIHGGRRAAALLFLGDIGTFAVSLVLTLALRYGTAFDLDILNDHVGPFSLLFAVWALVFYMSGLYGKRILLFRSSLADAIVKTQIFNIVLAALFFFFVPGIGIAPKTNLLIYLVVSLLLILFWRLTLYPRLSIPRYREAALLIADGEEADELMHEVNENKRYHLRFAHTVSPASLSEQSLNTLTTTINDEHISLIVTDTENIQTEQFLRDLYTLTSASKPIQFLSFTDVYEDVFDRIPLSYLRPGWFLKYANRKSSLLYATAKRTIDIIGALVMGAITLVSAPVIWVLNGFEGPGPLFISQDRIGYRGSKVVTLKFRSMQANDAGAWTGETKNKVTRVGNILRRTSLDEFPQFWNVLKGEVSLIGPRNDIKVLGERLAEALPNYNFRYTVRPGITGWAQINQQYEQGHISPQSIEETKMRLAYDFYYLKHRSLGLDVVIALKTIKRMFFRVSSW